MLVALGENDGGGGLQGEGLKKRGTVEKRDCRKELFRL